VALLPVRANAARGGRHPPQQLLPRTLVPLGVRPRLPVLSLVARVLLPHAVRFHLFRNGDRHGSVVLAVARLVLGNGRLPALDHYHVRPQLRVDARRTALVRGQRGADGRGRVRVRVRVDPGRSPDTPTPDAAVLLAVRGLVRVGLPPRADGPAVGPGPGVLRAAGAGRL